MDLIDRQAAIDALRTCYETETISMDNGDEYINYADAVAEIEQLPSAQPEIIQCKNCGWWQKEWPADNMGRHYCKMVDDRTDREFYCANAERRTDD